jgi:hypothetical protein
MRKIITKEERERRNKRNYLIFGIILILILIISGFGYAFNSREEEDIKKVRYNGIEFIKDASGYWRFNINGNSFITQYNPEETKDINLLSFSSIDNYANKPLYFVGDYNEPNFEIARNLNAFVLKSQGACLDENCTKDLPIKECSADNIIVINEPTDESEGITQRENCIYIVSNIQNQTRYADAFLFKILGI